MVLVYHHLLKLYMYFFYFLSYRTGFTHTAFSFAYESLVTKSSVSQIEIPPGALITFLQKGLEYVGIEEHINEVIECLLDVCTEYIFVINLYRMAASENSNEITRFSVLLYTKLLL